MNPFLERSKKKENAHGGVSEKRVVKSLGASQHPASGAMRGAKSDASLKDFRLEMKSTVNDTLPINIGWLSKITQEATSHNQKPAVVISFVDFCGKPRMKQNAEWVMMPKNVFEELIWELYT